MNSNYLPFEEARDYVREQKLETTRAWKQWSNGTLYGKERRPDFIPSNPDVVYRNDGWNGWTDWIKEPIEFLPFEEAREFVRSLGLESQSQWQKYYQGKFNGLEKPDNIPWNPKKVYEDQWKGIKDWIGTEWREFEEARDYVRSLGLNGQVEWRLYCKGELDGYEPKPADIPTDPKRVYDDTEWIDIADWLGTDRKRKTVNGEVDNTWMTYDEAENFIHSLKLNSYEEWKAYIDGRIEDLPKRPTNLPKSPQYVYKDDGWKNWTDWLGNYNNTSEEISNHTIIEKEKPIKEDPVTLPKTFSLDILQNEYSQNKTITRILDYFTQDTKLKSIVELELHEEEINEIEEILFHFRGEPGKQIQIKKAFIGLIFLTHVIYKLEPQLSYSSIWKIITDDLSKYSTITTFFLDSYFIGGKNPNFFLKEAIEYACHVFHLRNNFDSKDEQQYIRNTILLQIGLLNNSLHHLKLWLSNYNLPVIIAELLDSDSENYSKVFNEGWRVLRRYRDNILTIDHAKALLSQNIWFQHLDLNELLKAAKQRYKKQLMITQDEDLPVFHLEKINYNEDGLVFTINAQDLYSLNLSGFRYEVFIEDEYKGLLVANSSKELILEEPIVLSNPDLNQIDLEVKNEDGDVVFNTEIILFDFSEQMILFDEDGTIYQNIFKKLNSNKKYHILMDSDLDCNFNEDNQREYFDGYAMLVPFIGKKDDCKITYNDEVLFELNFTEHIEKPDFIDNLVLYTTSDPSFIIDNDYKFELKVMKMESTTEEVDLQALPEDSKIIKWSYSGGYADYDDIENNEEINSPLYPEMITSPKHTLLIKYKNRVFKKIVYCNFFEKHNIYRLFKIASDGTNQLVERTTCLTKNDLKSYRFYLSDFSRNEFFYIKNKSNVYQVIKPNRFVNFTKFSGFGETIFIADHLFNSKLMNIFDYSDTDEYISLSNSNELTINKQLPLNSKILVLDHNLQYHELSFNEINSNKKINFGNDIVSCLLILGSSVIDSTFNTSFLEHFNDYNNTEVVKNLILSNYQFLSKQSSSKFLRSFIVEDFERFFDIFYNEEVLINGRSLKLDFSKVNILFEHILFNLRIDSETSNRILQNSILNKQENMLLDTPIILFKLLQASSSNRLINYYYNFVENAELEDERDESFIDLIIGGLFDTTTLTGPLKHNLKVAMHYINSRYYLRKALEKLNG